MRITDETADTLRGLASGRRSVIEGLLGLDVSGVEDSGLDARTHALVSIAALVAIDAPAVEYAREVEVALDAGAEPGDVVGVLVAVAPHIGTSRVMRAAPALLDAFGLAPEPGPPGRASGR